MHSISQLDKKIQALQQKKEAVTTKSLTFMQKKLKEILGEDYSSELCMAIVSHTWHNAAPSQKQNLKKQAQEFQGLQKKRPYKRKSQQNPVHSHQAA